MQMQHCASFILTLINCSYFDARVCACLLQMIADRFWTAIHCRNILFTFWAIPSKGVMAILCKARLCVVRSASLALNSAAMRSWMIRKVHDYMYIRCHSGSALGRIHPRLVASSIPSTPAGTCLVRVFFQLIVFCEWSWGYNLEGVQRRSKAVVTLIQCWLITQPSILVLVFSISYS